MDVFCSRFVKVAEGSTHEGIHFGPQMLNVEI